jgi:hypothetical protein
MFTFESQLPIVKLESNSCCDDKVGSYNWNYSDEIDFHEMVHECDEYIILLPV